MEKVMTLIHKLRCIPKSYTAKISKDERYLIGSLAHEAAAELERTYCELMDTRAGLAACNKVLQEERVAHKAELEDAIAEQREISERHEINE